MACGFGRFRQLCIPMSYVRISSAATSMANEPSEIQYQLIQSWDGKQRRSPNVEDLVGFRDCLFCMGVHISGNSRWCARSSAIDSGGDALLGSGSRSIWLDDGAGRTLTEQAPMDVSIFTWDRDLRFRLRSVVLGRAARAFRYCRSHAGNNPGVYGAVGNHFPANTEAHRSFGSGAFDRDWRSGRAAEPLPEAW